MQEILQQLAERWIVYKIDLTNFVGLTNDAMHIHISLLLLLVSAILFRRRPDSIWCWLVVFCAELFNEYADIRSAAPDEATLDAAIHDIYNTMFWPTVILLLGRFLFPPRSKKGKNKEAVSSDLPDQSFKESATV
jgi:hypothetical protein